ncbi:MAG TPA: hypothetical protein VFW44_13880 [Bryobacteraceae bacterium]|nr:hypothetical protein [Bryobacteraceae bacterium]
MSPADFAELTGANVGFRPAHADEWMLFWKTDICEKDQFHTWFPPLSRAQARRVWIAMEEQFLSKYDDFLRVWPEWCSSGIWSPPYPGSRVAGGMVDYQYLPLPADLVERFKQWQAEFDNSEPCGPERLDWERHARIADGLARDLKQCVGPTIYVEHRELNEIMMDGRTRSCHPLLGLPEGD